MNWLKKLLNGALNTFKDDVSREIDRAIGKLQSGQTVGEAVDALHNAVAALLAKSKLPPPTGAILASLLMMVDWQGLSKKSADQAIVELNRLKNRIAGARL